MTFLTCWPFGLFTFCLIAVLIFRQVYPIFKLRHEKALLPDYARWISSVTESNATIISTDDRIFIEHYGKRKTAHNPCGLYYVNKGSLPGFKEWLDEKLKKGTPVYITGSGLATGDKTKEFRMFMLENYQIIYIGKHLSEDWHQGSTRLNAGQEHLYQIKSKDF